MSDYLTNIAARSLDRAPAVQPRLALLFEPPLPDASEPSLQEPESLAASPTSSPSSIANLRDAAAHGADSPPTGSHYPVSPHAGLVVPPPTSRAFSPKDSPETAAPRRAAETQTPEPRASEEFQRRDLAPAPDDAPRDAHVSPPPPPPATPAARNSRPTDETNPTVIDATRPAKRRPSGALDAGVVEPDAKVASGQTVGRVFEDAAPRRVAERSSSSGDTLSPSPPGTQQTSERASSSLLVPAPHGTPSARDDVSPPNVSSVTRVAANATAPAESHARAESQRLLRPRVETYANDESSATHETAPTIHVSIGRIEVRAVTPPTPSPAPSPAPTRPAPAMSLDEYLRANNGGRR